MPFLQNLFRKPLPMTTGVARPTLVVETPVVEPTPLRDPYFDALDNIVSYMDAKGVDVSPEPYYSSDHNGGERITIKEFSDGPLKLVYRKRKDWDDYSGSLRSTTRENEEISLTLLAGEVPIASATRTMRNYWHQSNWGPLKDDGKREWVASQRADIILDYAKRFATNT